MLIPWAIYSFINENVSMGIGLLIIYAIILVVRQIIEPKLVAGQAGLSPFVTIAAMYIGTKTLGILGFFILPFAVIVIKQLNDEGIIHIFKTSPQPAAEDTGGADAAADKAVAANEIAAAQNSAAFDAENTDGAAANTESPANTENKSKKS